MIEARQEKVCLSNNVNYYGQFKSGNSGGTL